MAEWVCYLIRSLDSNETYIGSTNNSSRRLSDHNSMAKSRRGAKRTRNRSWMPVIIISGFPNKISCLSFEAGWKRLAKRRSKSRMHTINLLSNSKFKYTSDTIYNRILDLLYFLHHISVCTDSDKYQIYRYNRPLISPPDLKIKIFLEEWIKDLPWPFYIGFN